jgi:hypothetical protein
MVSKHDTLVWFKHLNPDRVAQKLEVIFPDTPGPYQGGTSADFARFSLENIAQPRMILLHLRHYDVRGLF